MKLLHFTFVLCLVLTGAACTTLYVPNQPNVLLMSEGDETQIGLNVGSNGYGMTLGYSPYYHWVLAASGNTFSYATDSGFVIKQKHIYGEVATGYYTRLSKFARMEILAGYGTGSSGITNNRGLYRKVFLQPSVGISGPFVDAAFTPRLSWVSHFENRINGAASEVDASSVYLEPFLTFRAGWEQIKFQLQGGYSFEFGNPGYSNRGLVGSVGVHVTLFKDFDKYLD